MSHNYHSTLERYCLLALAAGVGLTVLARVASAGMISLADLNSQVSIDTTEAGISGWSLDSVNYAYNQALSYQVGSTGSLGSWQYQSSSVWDIGGHGQNDVAVIQYLGDSGLQLTQIYTLVGSQPGSGSSNLSEQIEITNGGSSPAQLQLLQSNNFATSNGAAVLQSLPPSQAYQAPASETADLTVASLPTAYESLTASALSNMLAKASPAASASANGSAADDPASATEWAVQLGAGKSYAIGQEYSLNTLNAVPEPSTVLLLAALAVSFAVARLWRRGIAGPA